MTPREQCDWLEEGTMGVLRTAFLDVLARADAHGRLRVLYPVVPDLDGECVNVHSKLVIVDDELARIGSANLSERSMRLDTECDLAVEARGRRDLRAAIAALRHRLLGEHLGLDAEVVGRAERELGSTIAAIELLRSGARTLVPLDWRRRRGWVGRAMADVLFVESPLWRLGRALAAAGGAAARKVAPRSTRATWGGLAMVATAAAAIVGLRRGARAPRRGARAIARRGSVSPAGHHARRRPTNLLDSLQSTP